VIVWQEVGVVEGRPWEVEDELWELIEPLLPKVERRFRNPGRKRLDNRKALCGILFVLYTGICGSSCRRRWDTGRG
jgi:hypothetical protein